MDNFLGQMVGELFHDQEFSHILSTRSLNLVRLNTVASLNNSLNIPFEVVDKAFKEFVTIHRGNRSVLGSDFAAHTECCYKRAMSIGFTPATMQRGWAFINLERAWQQADVFKRASDKAEWQNIEQEKERIRDAWADLERRRVWVEQQEVREMRLQQQQN